MVPVRVDHRLVQRETCSSHSRVCLWVDGVNFLSVLPAVSWVVVCCVDTVCVCDNKWLLTWVSLEPQSLFCFQCLFISQSFWILQLCPELLFPPCCRFVSSHFTDVWQSNGETEKLLFLGSDCIWTSLWAVWTGGEVNLAPSNRHVDPWTCERGGSSPQGGLDTCHPIKTPAFDSLVTRLINSHVGLRSDHFPQ